MELWIRSQDKEIMLQNPILIIDDNRILTPKNDYRDTHLLLGHYKSKERALEVLDEIQEILEQILDGNLTILPVFVYEMPED